jgi:acyl dehydratase
VHGGVDDGGEVGVTAPRPVVGTRLPPVEMPVTRRDLVRYADASGDRNPIHRDDEAARRAGLPGVIAHGMLTMGLVGRVLTAWAGEGTVVEYHARFRRPVVVPAGAAITITVAGAVTALTGDGIALVELSVHCGSERVLAAARARVRFGAPAGPR